jgi:hypothetical protein
MHEPGSPPAARPFGRWPGATPSAIVVFAMMTAAGEDVELR